MTLSFAITRSVRKTIIRRKLRQSPNRDHLKVDVDMIVKNFNFADWKLLYHLLR